MGFVPCDHEYLDFKGGMFSKSRGAAVEVPYYLCKYNPDPLRFYLTATAPETCDTEACPEGTEGSPWEDFVERNNDELVATWGNLGQRPRGLGSARGYSGPLSFASKRLDGKVPKPAPLEPQETTWTMRTASCWSRSRAGMRPQGP